MNGCWPHKGEQWTHKDGSGLVIIDAMFENDTFYDSYGHKYTCATEMFKKSYMKR